MAETMTFTSLKTDIQRYLERGDSATTDADVFDQIPRLINLAERRIATELKLEGFLRVVTTTFTNGVSVYNKPERWKRTTSMHIVSPTDGETRIPIFPRGYEYLRSFWPDGTAEDQPEFYADYDFDHWVIAPTPDADYSAEIAYYEMPALLDSSNETNWITDHAPQLLLYATLLEASPFLKNDKRIAVWQGMYDRAAAMFNGEDLSRVIDRSVQREGN